MLGSPLASVCMFAVQILLDWDEAAKWVLSCFRGASLPSSSVTVTGMRAALLACGGSRAANEAITRVAFPDIIDRLAWAYTPVACDVQVPVENFCGTNGDATAIVCAYPTPTARAGARIDRVAITRRATRPFGERMRCSRHRRSSTAKQRCQTAPLSVRYRQDPCCRRAACRDNACSSHGPRQWHCPLRQQAGSGTRASDAPTAVEIDQHAA